MGDDDTGPGTRVGTQYQGPGAVTWSQCGNCETLTAQWQMSTEMLPKCTIDIGVQLRDQQRYWCSDHSSDQGIINVYYRARVIHQT